MSLLEGFVPFWGLAHAFIMGWPARLQSLPFANGPKNKARVAFYLTTFVAVGFGAPFIIAKWT